MSLRSTFARASPAVVALIAWWGAGFCRAAEVDPASPRPNVLFLLTDDQREDSIGALGNPRVHTPRLDALVRDGFIFRNAYCMGGYSAAVCLPSRQMLLTGRAWFSVRGLGPDAPNLARSMNAAGYFTYHHGKRGNTPHDIHRQFASSRYVDDEADRRSGEPGKEIADAAIEFLRERRGRIAAGRAEKPFFLYLAFANPHDPRIAAEAYLSRYDVRTVPLPANFAPFHPFDNGELLVRDEKLAPWPRPEDDLRRQIREYWAVVTALDRHIGRILDGLDEVGERGRTIVVFASDQGIALGSHGLMGKQNLYEHSMGAPLVFSGPGIPRGATSDALAYLFDVYPTICDLVGAPVPASLDGRSLAPILAGKADGVRDAVLLAYRDAQRAVRRGRWKLIRYPAIDRTQLFDLESDPQETKDLSGDPAEERRVRELLAALAEEQRRFGDALPLDVPEPRKGAVDLELFRAAARGRIPPASKAR